MTLSLVVLWSFLRSLILATIALGPAIIIFGWLRPKIPLFRRWGLFVVLIPVLMPELLIGFTARVPAAELIRNRWGTEFFYCILQLFRTVSVAASLMLMAEGGTVSREAEHSWSLLRSRLSSVAWLTGWLRLRCEGRWRSPLVAWCLMVLLGFQEFETAALMQLSEYPVSWSVSLFDAHATRQPLTDSLRMTALPVTCQLCVLIPCLILLRRGFAVVSRQVRNVSEGSLTVQRLLGESCTVTESVSWIEKCRVVFRLRIMSAVALAWLTVGVVIFVFWPLYSSGSELLGSLNALSRQPGMFTRPVGQILTSVGFSTAAALMAYCLSQLLVQSGRSLTALLLLLPGLIGPLVTSLILLAMFQLPVLHWMYDTWLPMLLGLTFAVLPKAWLITSLLKSRQDDAAVHSAELLCASADDAVRQSGRRLLWKLKYAGWCFGGVLIGHWCFWDVTTASILRPLRTEPVVTRLYNEMHYGRTETLTLMAVLSLLMPIAVGLCGIGVVRLLTMIRRKA